MAVPPLALLSVQRGEVKKEEGGWVYRMIFISGGCEANLSPRNGPAREDARVPPGK